MLIKVRATLTDPEIEMNFGEWCTAYAQCDALAGLTLIARFAGPSKPPADCSVCCICAVLHHIRQARHLEMVL